MILRCEFITTVSVWGQPPGMKGFALCRIGDEPGSVLSWEQNTEMHLQLRDV